MGKAQYNSCQNLDVNITVQDARVHMTWAHSQENDSPCDDSKENSTACNDSVVYDKQEVGLRRAWAGLSAFILHTISKNCVIDDQLTEQIRTVGWSDNEVKTHTFDWNSLANDCARERRANLGADSMENLAPPRSAAVAPADEPYKLVRSQAFIFCLCLGVLGQPELTFRQVRTATASELG